MLGWPPSSRDDKLTLGSTSLDLSSCGVGGCDGLGDPTGQDRTIRLEALPDGFQAQLIKAAEGGQVRSGQVKAGQVKVATSHPKTHSQTCRGLPDGWRENPHHRKTSTPTRPTTRQTDYTLVCEEPLDLAPRTALSFISRYFVSLRN